MSRVALGIKPHAGRAELVVLAENGEVPECAEVPHHFAREGVSCHTAECRHSNEADRKSRTLITAARRTTAAKRCS